MQLLMLVAAAVLILIAALMLVLDMIGRAEIVRRRWPRAWDVVTSRPLITLLLLTCLVLLDRDFKDVMATGPLPPIIVRAPLAPSIQSDAQVAFREPRNSLRKRVIRLAEDLESLLRELGATLPSQQDLQTMTQEQKNVSNQKYQEVSNKITASYLDKFRPRTVGIIAELKAKGLLTEYWDGPLEKGAEFRPLQGEEIHRLRELAYHLDAQDRVIIISGN
jgi:hypothetical protein